MTDIAFAFEIDGQNVDPSEMTDPQTAAQLLRIAEGVLDRMEGIYCEEHQQAPRFLCHGSDPLTLSLEVFGCCDTLIARAEQRLGEAAD